LLKLDLSAPRPDGLAHDGVRSAYALLLDSLEDEHEVAVARGAMAGAREAGAALSRTRLPIVRWRWCAPWSHSLCSRVATNSPPFLTATGAGARAELQLSLAERSLVFA